MNALLPPKIKKFPAAKQRLLDRLLDRNGEGKITPAERVKLEQLVAEAEELAIANAKRLAQFSDRENGGASVGAMPVTVWVRPEPKER